MLARFLASPPDFLRPIQNCSRISRTISPQCDGPRRQHVQVPRRSRAIPPRPAGDAADFRLPPSGSRRPPMRAATESPASRLASTWSASRSSALAPGRSEANSGEVVPCMEEHFPSPPSSARTIAPPHMPAVGRTERGYPFARPVVRRVIATVKRLQRITLTVTRTKRPRFAKRRRHK